MPTNDGKREEDSAPGPKAPEITLPKGGGALRSVDEKFTVNAVNGSCTLGVSLPFSKTRSGFDSQLALRYDSGSGNGTFGLGWSLSLPSIRRGTDRRLPRYEDALDSDVFVFSGADDLVPAQVGDGAGNWSPDVFDDGTVRVVRYRPRIEGTFSRIEQVTVAGESSSYWKVTSRDNVATIFGRTAAARVADPDDATRVFAWLPEWSYDDKGNCFQLVYKDEDLTGTPDVVDEKNRRSGLAPFANKHPKRVLYGNKTPYLPGTANPFDPPPPATPSYFFEAVFDYGDHDAASPTPAEAGPWPCRFDPFGDFRAGFEQRTYRLCRRVLFFHSFAELDPSGPVLVRSLDFAYQHFQFDGAPYRGEEVELLRSIRTVFHRGSVTKALPAVELSYQEPDWSHTVETLEDEDRVPPDSQWLDLFGDGAPGLLTEQGNAWYFKRNEGGGRFGAALSIVPKPSFTGVASGALQFQDLAADGSKQLVSLHAAPRGYFALDDHDEWQPFRAFGQVAPDLDDPNARFIDLDGDGKPDLIVAEENVFRWYPSLGTEGFDGPRLASKESDEERGPAVVFAEEMQSVFIADMNGDGLADIVRVRNGDVSYWPNRGYGRFGARVTMRNAPRFDGEFDATKLQLADVSGTGAADLIWLGDGRFRAWTNLSGNAWSDPLAIEPFPGTEPPNRVAAVDLLGNGTIALVWSSPLPANASAPIRYVDLMGGRKPYVLNAVRNNLGKEVTIEYRSSTHYAMRDRAGGRPWATKLPFPTMCVSRTETRDTVSGCRFVQEYRYRHGYYDHAEREFRGFAMVEQVDTESFERFRTSGATNIVDASLHQPPVRTRTWYHTGAFVRGEQLLGLFAADYFAGLFEEELPDAFIDPLPATPLEMRDAARACKGMVLRQEVYADDGSAEAAYPYSTVTRNCVLRVLQPRDGDRSAVVLPVQSETITRGYERVPADPRITHQVDTVVDELGNVLESASIAYPRAIADGTLPPEVQQEQARLAVSYTVRAYTNDVAVPAAYRLRQQSEELAYELTGASAAGSRFTRDEIRAHFVAAAPRAFEDAPSTGVVQKRLLSRSRTLLADDANPSAGLPLHVQQALGLPFQQYKLVLTPTLRTSLYGTRVTDAILTAARYVRSDDAKAAGLFPAGDANGEWWNPSGAALYPPNPEQHFYLPDRYVDPFGSTTTVRYFSDYHLLVDRVEDALLSATTALDFDFRVLQPRSVSDPNDNVTDVAFDAAGLVAGVAMRGKGAEADDLTGFTADLTDAEVAAFFADPETNGATVLQHASSRFVYRFDVIPAAAATIERETHHQAALATGTPSKLRYAFEYSDGLGRVAMKKAQAEPGLARRAVVNGDGTVTITSVDTTPSLRWIGSGRSVFNNKGKQVMQYEPYFSATHGYETAPELVAGGVTAVTHYDAPGRVVRTDSPDGSYSLIEIGGWRQRIFDVNDTVLTSDWYAARIGGALGAFEQAAAQKTAVHANTPGETHFDSLGRAIANLAHNRFADRVTLALVDQHSVTRDVLDVDGRKLAVFDERGNAVMQYAYDLAGRPCRTVSMDGGERRMFQDVLGNDVFGWDAKGNRFETVRDALHRPIRSVVLTSAMTTFVDGRTTYGTDRTLNQNGKVVAQFDDSGVVAHLRYDFKGKALESQRRFTSATTGGIDWTTPAAIALEAPHVTLSAYDALARLVSTTTPDGSVSTFTYSESGQVTSVTASVRGAVPRPFIVRIRHDAKAQREEIEYGNGVTSRLTYDANTFRVRRIETTPTAGGAALQDLAYTYDPAGNVTSVRDHAQQSLFFNNQLVEPHQDFVYDAAYRLVEANGREHIALNVPTSRFDAERMNLAHRADGNAVQRYREQYEYDLAGNLTAVVHNSGTGPFTHRWTRQLTPRATNNQLLSSAAGTATETLTYDAHGNLSGITGLAPLDWDEHDRFRSAGLGGGGSARYTYDSGNQRARKIVQRAGGAVEERRYLGLVEIFTRTQNGAVELRRETLHVMDGARRLAMVDTRTDGAGPGPAQLLRFQFSNHLDSAALELDELANVISYEEYYPFGSTSFQSVDGSREVPARRYRYTGKERDEETGFTYHGARYYAPWLGRWISRDPAGIEDGLNVYAYARNRPTVLADPSGTQGDDDPLHLLPPTPGPSLSVGPLRFSDIRLRSSEDESSGRLRLRGGFVSQFQVGDVSFLSGLASGNALLDLQHRFGGFATYEGEAAGTIDAGPFQLRAGGWLSGSTTTASGPFSPVGWQHQLRGALSGSRTEGSAHFSLGVGGMPLGYGSFTAQAEGTAGTFSGRVLLGIPGLPSAIPIARIGTSGTFSYDLDQSRFRLGGSFSLISPVAVGGGTYSYDSAPGGGFRAEGGYFGLQVGPTGLGVDLQPFRPGQERSSYGPVGSGIVNVFEPGFSIGGTYINHTSSRTIVFSVGVAPSASIQHYSLEQPHPSGILSGAPGVRPIIESLYGRPLSSDAGVFGGATLKIWF